MYDDCCLTAYSLPSLSAGGLYILLVLINIFIPVGIRLRRSVALHANPQSASRCAYRFLCLSVQPSSWTQAKQDCARDSVFAPSVTVHSPSTQYAHLTPHTVGRTPRLSLAIASSVRAYTHSLPRSGSASRLFASVLNLTPRCQIGISRLSP
jgi:hypothetical protein